MMKPQDKETDEVIRKFDRWVVRTGEIRAAGHVIEVLRLHLLLVSLTVIEVVEVGDDDGYGQGDRQHAGDRAQRAHDLPPDADRPEADGKSSVLFSGRPLAIER